jgi:hypothetical protein
MTRLSELFRRLTRQLLLTLLFEGVALCAIVAAMVKSGAIR